MAVPPGFLATQQPFIGPTLPQQFQLAPPPPVPMPVPESPVPGDMTIPPVQNLPAQNNAAKRYARQRILMGLASGLAAGVQPEGFFGNFARAFGGAAGGAYQVGQQQQAQQRQAAKDAQAASDQAIKNALAEAQTINQLSEATSRGASKVAPATEKTRLYEELLGQGVDKATAFGVAYGLTKNQGPKTPFELYQTDPNAFAKWIAASKTANGLTGGDLTPAAKDMLAKNFAMTGSMPAMGMGAAPTRVAIMNQAAAKYPQADIASNRAQYQADQKTLGALQPAQGLASAFGNMADYNVKQLEGELKKIPNYGNQVANVVARGIATKMGDPHMAAFNTAREIVRNEYARLLSTLGQGSAVLPEGARKDMGDILDKAQTPEQIISAIKILRQDAKNKISAINGAIGTAQKRLRSFEAAGGNLYGSQNQENTTGGVNWIMDENGNLVPSQ